MIIEKQNPVGVDAVIGKAQKVLHDKLSTLWNVNLEAYPRCYLLYKKEGKTIEHYNGNKEYSGNLIFTEGNKLFFLANSEQKNIDNLTFQTNVSLYFILNAEEIYPEILHRCDSEIIADILKALSYISSISIEKKIVTDFNEIFDVTYFKKDNRNIDSNFENMQPYLFLKFDFTVNYTIDKKNNCN